MNKLQINSKFEKFNFEQYNRLLQADPSDKETSREIELINDKVLFINVFQGNPYTIVKYIDLYFLYYRRFYSNGNIKEKGLSLNTNRYFKKSIWYYFDENGNFTHQIDYDKNYKFTFEDVVAFCKKRGINIKEGQISLDGVYYTRINRNITEEGKPIWKISHFLPQDHAIEEIILDGNNGKIINEREYTYVY